MLLKRSLYLLYFLLSFFVSNAQKNEANTSPKKVVLSGGIGGAMFQFSSVEFSGFKFKSIPRFSYFFNTGVDINFHVFKQVTPFTGFQLRNIGIILKPTDSIKTKERIYTIGAPLGVKYYLKDKKSFVAAGADIGLAFNYKYKLFYNGEKNYKENEFFSNNTSLMQSSVFVGTSLKGVAVYLNYYLNNFYSNSLSSKKANLLIVSLNFDIDKKTIQSKVK
ncbi:MAG: hypothetical protein IT215_00280 [Chitinophagaceae bacterium]|nr:hypothetical protein [Chitinophagaceae bacterium]HMN32047.1 hypothetical protein [Chitinophagaceae bacterium]